MRHGRGLASHIAARLMVAMHAARRGEARAVADLLDGHVAEGRDNEALRALTRAFVNDQPIRQRAIRFRLGLSGQMALVGDCG